MVVDIIVIYLILNDFLIIAWEEGEEESKWMNEKIYNLECC